LVPPGDAEALAGALADLLGSPDLIHTMGAAAADRIQDRCDPDRVAGETLAGYEEAIALAGRRTRRWRR
jgi:hypothetical protein